MFNIIREPNGKVVATDKDVAVSLSLTHDERYVVGAAGATPQGVDIEPIAQRKWETLLANGHLSLHEQLQNWGDSADCAGTRIWCAREAVFKALGSMADHLHVTERRERSVIFEAKLDDGRSCGVLTVPLQLTLGNERMLSLVIEPSAKSETEEPALPVKQNGSGATLASVGFDPSTYTMDGDPERKQFIMRWPLTFRACANLSRSVYITRYFDWMGTVRETAMQPIFEQLSADMMSGVWGMVTNSATTTVVGDAHMGDTIEVRYWVSRSAENPDARISLNFDWSALKRDGNRERIAYSKLDTTWVRLVSHGQVQSEPLPGYFEQFVNLLTPPTDTPPLSTTRGALQGLKMGAVQFEQPSGPARGPLLGSKLSATTLQDSNLVGNIYYANYAVWAARLVDSICQPLVPHVYRAMGTLGELRCIYSNVDHLVDAMPFDEIETEATLPCMAEHGFEVTFDYFRSENGKKVRKLATGTQRYVWLTNGGEPGAIPAPLTAFLQQCIANHQSQQ